MKSKFNLKLTIFLVSLFVSLLLVILGGKVKLCLSFGFIIMGVSLFLFIWYNNERIKKALDELNEKIDEIDALDNDYEYESQEEEDEAEEEKVYILKELYSRQGYVEKKKKSMFVMFGICGLALIVLGFFALF